MAKAIQMAISNVEINTVVILIKIMISTIIIVIMFTISAVISAALIVTLRAFALTEGGLSVPVAGTWEIGQFIFSPITIYFANENAL